MKKLLLLTQFFTLSCLSGYCQVDNSVLFDVNFNGDYNDNSVYNLTPAINGPVTLDSNRFGIENTALRFNGSSSAYLDFGKPAHLNNSESFTVSFWFKGGSTELGDYETLLHKYDLGIGLYDVNTPLVGGLWDYDWNDNSYDWENREFYPEYDSTSWHHIVLIKENDSIFYYRNNLLRGKNQGYQAISFDFENIIIGKTFEGVMDEILIFQGRITEEEITYLFEKSDDLITSVNSGDENTDSKFYPNPVVDYLHTNKASNITVYGPDGTKLLDVKNASKINLQDLIQGMYFVKINGTKMYKIIKK